MKRLILFFILLKMVEAKAQDQITRENFENHNLKNVIFLFSEVRFGNFIYEFRYNGMPVDSSSIATFFDGDGSIFVGHQKKVTDFRIKSYNGDKFSLNNFQLSSNHPYPNADEEVVVRGWLDGKAVTPPITIEIRFFEPPGSDFDMTFHPGFEKVDEIKITGNNLSFTLESFTYRLFEQSVVSEKEDKK